MKKLTYKKPYRNGTSLVIKLMSEGLLVSDRSKAADIIEKISYYRFKAYCIPFRKNNRRFYDGSFSEQPIDLRSLTFYPNGKNTFRYGVHFDYIYGLYLFDSELKSRIFESISHIEVAIRAKLDQFITEDTGNPFWYLDARLFKDLAANSECNT